MRVEEYKDKHFTEFYSLYLDWDMDFTVNKEDVQTRLAMVLDHPENRVLLVTEGDAVLAYAQIRDSYDIGLEPYLEIIQLLVKKSKRSKGVGKLLLQEIETLARSKGFSGVKLHSNIIRSRAHVFYERNGYNYFKCSKFYEKNLHK